jgi:hypothetical protein
MNSIIYFNQIFTGIAALTSGLYLFYGLDSGKSLISSLSKYISLPYSVIYATEYGIAMTILFTSIICFCVPTITNIELLAKESSIPKQTLEWILLAILLLCTCCCSLIVKAINTTLFKLGYYAQGGLPHKCDFFLERYFTPCLFIGIVIFALWSINLHYRGMRSLQWPTASVNNLQLSRHAYRTTKSVYGYITDAEYSFKVKGKTYTGTHIFLDNYCSPLAKTEIGAIAYEEQLNKQKNSKVHYNPASPDENCLFPGPDKTQDQFRTCLVILLLIVGIIKAAMSSSMSKREALISDRNHI